MTMIMIDPRQWPGGLGELALWIIEALGTPPAIMTALWVFFFILSWFQSIYQAGKVISAGASRASDRVERSIGEIAAIQIPRAAFVALWGTALTGSAIVGPASVLAVGEIFAGNVTTLVDYWGALMDAVPRTQPIPQIVAGVAIAATVSAIARLSLLSALCCGLIWMAGLVLYFPALFVALMGVVALVTGHFGPLLLFIISIIFMILPSILAGYAHEKLLEDLD